MVFKVKPIRAHTVIPMHKQCAQPIHKVHSTTTYSWAARHFDFLLCSSRLSLISEYLTFYSSLDMNAMFSSHVPTTCAYEVNRMFEIEGAFKIQPKKLAQDNLVESRARRFCMAERDFFG